MQAPGCRQDNSGGDRLLELNALLRHTVMVRRLKRDVMSELPPKRRQVVGRCRLTVS